VSKTLPPKINLQEKRGRRRRKKKREREGGGREREREPFNGGRRGKRLRFQRNKNCAISYGNSL
jgi:hypothetical protein